MLTSPQTVTVNAVDKTLHKVSDDERSSVYKTKDDKYELIISHQKSGKRTRRMVRINNTIIAADPLTATNAYKKGSVYMVIDEPEFGFDDDDLVYLVDALKTWMDSTNTNAVLASRH